MLLVTGLLAPSSLAAIISGTVTDESGKPVRDARIDHIGARVVNSPPAYTDVSEPRTDTKGYFKITTDTAAFVIRKPGYESSRIAVSGDAKVKISLQRIKPSTCKVEPFPEVKTKQMNDADYVETVLYIDTKDGPRGIRNGSGPSYSFGAPSDQVVARSLDYFEVMYESGVIDARGHTADGKYWRLQSRFGAAAHYYGVDRETAEILDCIMDRVLVK
jgi:hypothetical protein